MKKILTSLFCIFICTGIGYQTFAQKKPMIRLFTQLRADSDLSYCFFTGPDAGMFSTSIKGLGSGVFDAFGARGSIDVINIGPERFYLSLGAGFAVLKYRLVENLIFENGIDGATTAKVDPDPTHNYQNTFFGYGKSKLITTSFYFPADINIGLTKNMMFSAGGYIDLNLTARYKMKYMVGDVETKEIIKSSDFRTFNPSTTKFGVSASLLFAKRKMGISGYYSLTPFFKSGMGPDIHEARVSLTFTLQNLKKKPVKKQEGKETLPL